MLGVKMVSVTLLIKLGFPGQSALIKRQSVQYVPSHEGKEIVPGQGN